jgi:hypothetical protein
MERIEAGDWKSSAEAQEAEFRSCRSSGVAEYGTVRLHASFLGAISASRL